MISCHVHDLIKFHHLMKLTLATEETSHNVTAAKSKVLHRAVYVVRNRLKTNLDHSRKRIALEVEVKKFPSQHAAFKPVLLHA